MAYLVVICKLMMIKNCYIEVVLVFKFLRNKRRIVCTYMYVFLVGF